MKPTCVCFLFKTVCLWASPRKIFILSRAGFVISPVRNLMLYLNVLRFKIFPDESSSLVWGTETGCYRELKKCLESALFFETTFSLSVFLFSLVPILLTTPAITRLFPLIKFWIIHRHFLHIPHLTLRLFS